MTAESALESALRRDRLIVTVALIAVTLVAWAYVLAGAGTGMSPIAMSRTQSEPMSEAAPSAMSQGRPALGEAASGMAAMPDMTPAGEESGDRSAATREAMAAVDIEVADMGMMTSAAWTVGYVVMMFFMWWAMMVAMMLPSAAPVILLFATVNRKQRPSRPIRVDQRVRRGLPGHLGWVQPGRGRAAMDLAAAHFALAYGGEHEFNSRRPPATGCRALPVEPHQTGLPAPLSASYHIPGLALAAGHRRCRPDGA